VGSLVLSQTSWLNLKGERKKSREGNGNTGGAITGDGEEAEEWKKGIDLHIT